MFKVNNVNDLDLLYSILREQNPHKQVTVTYNYNTKEYILKVTDEPYKDDPNVPVDLKIEVVYGDSVTGDTPLVLRNPDTNQVCIRTIESLCSEWNEYPEFKLLDQSIRLEKQYGTTNLQVWCDQGWNPIRKVIRHKTNKTIYRVLTHTGVVDVTEDHSLCKSNLEKIKPIELTVGQELLHSFPSQFVENEVSVVKMSKCGPTKVCKECQDTKHIDEFYQANHKKNIVNDSENKPIDYQLTLVEAQCWGFFFGDGCSDSYSCNGGKKSSWTLNNNSIDRLMKYKMFLESIEPVRFKILDTLESSGVYKLVPVGSIKYMVDKYRPLFYDVHDANQDGDKLKVVPDIILNASREIKHAFWEGYWDADGSKTRGDLGFGFTKPSFTVKGKIGAQGLYYLMRSLGIDMGINVFDQVHKQQYNYLEYTTFQKKKPTEVKKVFPLSTTSNDFVYDLETECGRFNAGVGQLTLNNTDSVFLRFKYNRNDFESNRKDTFNLATICGDKLTEEIFARPPIEMEFEKVFQPFILLTKKRYIANKYENTKDPFQLKGVDAKGIALTRRDYCKLVKDCYRDIIDAIMQSQDEDGLRKSLDVFKSYIKRIDRYEANTDDLVVSAMLAKSYKSDNIAHVNLAKKLKERKEEVQVGDRIPYIFIENDNPKAKKSDLAEDPVYAKKNGLKYNRSCYLEQLAKPILGFYRVVLKEYPHLLDGIIDYVNTHLHSYGGKGLKPSDFKTE